MREREREGREGSRASWRNGRGRCCRIYRGQKGNERWPRGYPALSTRDFVVNNASSWRRTRRSESWQSVHGPVGPSPSHSLALPLSLPFASLPGLTRARTLFPSPYPVLSSPVPISLRNLSRINWFDPDVSSRGTPIGHRSHAARLVRFVAPFSPPSLLLVHPTGPRPPFFSFPPRSQIFAKVTWPNPRREGRRGRAGRKRAFL